MPAGGYFAFIYESTIYIIPGTKPKNVFVCNIFLWLPPHRIYQDLAEG